MLRKIETQNQKRFYNWHPLWHLKKLTQTYSIIVAVFYCFFKIFAANSKWPKAVNPIRPNQRKPFCIAIDRDLGLTEFSRKKKQKEIERNIWNGDFVLIFLFDSEYIKTSVFANWWLKYVD